MTELVTDLHLHLDADLTGDVGDSYVLPADPFGGDVLHPDDGTAMGADLTPVPCIDSSCCQTSDPVDMEPGSSVQWTAPTITVNLDGQVVTLGTPNVDSDGDGRFDTYTAQSGGSIVAVRDADHDGIGESYAVYNSAGQLTASLALDPTTGTWQPVTADAYTDTVGQPQTVAAAPAASTGQPSYVVVQPQTQPQVVPEPASTVNPATSDATTVSTISDPTFSVGPADYSGNPSMVLFDSAQQMLQRNAHDLWSMAHPGQDVPSSNPAVTFADLAQDMSVDKQIRDVATASLDAINASTQRLLQ